MTAGDDETGEARPALRVAVFGEPAALDEFTRFAATLAWPSWRWRDPEHDPDDFEVSARVTPLHRLIVALARDECPRACLARFDADALLLVSATHPIHPRGPARMYGRSVFPRATLLLWLGEASSAAREGRALRGVLRAHGLPPDEAAMVLRDLDPRGEQLTQCLDAITPGHPDETRAAVREETDGTRFTCRGCGRALTRCMRRVGSHPWPGDGAKFEYNRKMFPGGGVFAYDGAADRWGREQPAPTPTAEPEVALLDARDALRHVVSYPGPSGGGCCGGVPVGEMNVACACGARVGYVWSECVFYSAVVLRLDRARPERVVDHPK